MYERLQTYCKKKFPSAPLSYVGTINKLDLCLMVRFFMNPFYEKGVSLIEKEFLETKKRKVKFKKMNV
jgi:hypothetical protein